MDRYHVRRAARAAHLSGFERRSLVTGPLLMAAAVVLVMATESVGGSARAVAAAGLATLALCAAVRGVRLYRAGAIASMPTSVAKVYVRIRPRRVSTATTVGSALVLPAVACVAFLALVEWAWLPVALVVLLGAVAHGMRALNGRVDDRPYVRDAPRSASVLLERLCMRADIPVPELVVEAGPTATAWTTGGRIHVTPRLLRTLDPSELEAVLAHELAHLAHRDAAVMDVCSAPSRILLGFVELVAPGLRGWLRLTFVRGQIGVLTGLCVPPAFLLGWLSRLSVLGMSRSREFAADAAAATLTGRPSALASALMKLDEDSGLLPRADLRRTEALAVLCILGFDRSKLGPLFCTHPRTAVRVRRLQALEERIHTGS